MDNKGEETGHKGQIAPAAKYKIVFLGDQSVGKTSIINKYIFDIFDTKNHVQIYPALDDNHEPNSLANCRDWLRVENDTR